ncbi:NAD-dependent protein deacylase [Bacillus methanolicus]|uniref:NAD-dependent protein deacetylase n=1 Tax=Bacillus methanolicus (strain MGA3 / ATCC 53907) TaxID=796606 RepID=I3E886_BACMM|nr:NAD-dependent protein deacylase [Bacillus methanolicus]AIE59982.1 NAD-dependent protein deacetylase 2 [Bacillus methanolicus MGA3]EIJ82707.1 NAD-dependent deacetylase [Bacillus methanolicus MGA3]UQD51991.1 NAD-dependent protein deacylase [Bacillus methanolicus]
MKEIKELAQIIKNAKTITIFTGAGMSTESGIPDFRSDNGIYSQEDNVENYISEYYFEKNPKDFWSKFKRIFSLKLMGNFDPNEGHLFLKELEEMGKNVTILTQNIDGLHHKAGNSDIIELHGTLQTATCPKCKTKYDLKFINEHVIPRCNQTNKKGEVCNFILKPDVVLFGGMVQHFEEALNKAYKSDLFIAMGTSLEVYPVNQIPVYLNSAPEIKKAIINKSPTKMDYLFDIVIHEGIGDTVAKIKQYL